jgi:hypothetical protein
MTTIGVNLAPCQTANQKHLNCLWRLKPMLLCFRDKVTN